MGKEEIERTVTLKMTADEWSCLEREAADLPATTVEGEIAVAVRAYCEEIDAGERAYIPRVSFRG